jgi:hypothetical protein
LPATRTAQNIFAQSRLRKIALAQEEEFCSTSIMMLMGHHDPRQPSRKIHSFFTNFNFALKNVLLHSTAGGS